MSNSIPFRQIHLDFHTHESIEGVGADFDPAEFAETLIKARVNSINLFARCHHGWMYYDSQAFPERKHPNLKRNLLKEQIAACKARGIKTPVYVTVQWDAQTAEAHPEWCCMDQTAKISGRWPYAPGFYATLCVNTPYRDWLFQHVSDISANLAGAGDGYWFDILLPQDCSCNTCRRDMIARGIDVIDAKARKEYYFGVLDRFKQDMTKHVQSLEPEALVFYNAGHVGPKTRAAADAYTHFEMESLPYNWGYTHFPTSVRYARTLGKEHLGMTGKFHTVWGDFHSFKNQAALEFECFSMVANGSKCCIGDQLHPRGKICEHTYELIGSIYSQIEKREPWLKDAAPVTEIALLTPESFTGGDEFYRQHQHGSRNLIRVAQGMGPHLLNDAPQEDIEARWREPDAGFSAVSYYFARKLFDHFKGQVPVGIVCYVAIVPAEAWVDAGRIAGHPNLKHLEQSPMKVAGKGFNGTIAPISPYAIRGVAYYQGEYNGARAQEFRYLFPTLIDSWREAWERPELPFLYVQLPGFLYHNAGKDSKLDMDAATLARQKQQAKMQWVDFRDVQRWIWQNTKNTGMVCAIDLGEEYDIHPKNKEPVGDRLLAQARKLAYEEHTIASGPYPKSCNVAGNSIIIDYDDIGSGLMAKDDQLDGFEIAGIDGNYVKANASINGTTVVVSADEINEPLHVRYAWEGFPPTTLYNQEGFPAIPFSYLTPGRTFYPDTAQFNIFNPSFEDRKGEKPVSWILRGEVSSIQNGREGVSALSLANKGYAGQAKIATGAGYYWNSPPVTKHFLRPGCVVGYSVDLASGTEGQEAKAYMNMACDNNAGGAYGMWTPVHQISVKHSQWARYSLAHKIVDKKIHPMMYDDIGGRWINQSETSPLLIDNFSAVQIIRPTLQINSTAPIELKVGETSRPIVVSNSQRKIFTQKLGPESSASPVATTLYGCAGFTPDERGLMQKILERTDHVGAILIGKDAGKFELVGPSANGTHVRLIGSDKQLGLHGGETPESESFSVKLKDGVAPGKYEAAVRIVTQAANTGIISTGETNQPPVNLYYTDIVVRAE